MRRPSARQLVRTLAFDFPVILDLSKPSVTLHKNGKYLLFKPNDLAAADILRELKIRMECNKMHLTSFFGFVEEETVDVPVANGTVKTHRHKQVSDWGRIELWKHLGGDVNKHPLCDMLRSYGVEVGTSPTLMGYILKEHKRRVLEEFPYPASPIVKDDVSLFGRCCPGTTLVCVKDFAPAGATAPLFKKGSRYLVASTGENEGCDQIQICIEAITHNAKLNLVGKGKLHSWTEFNPSMEEWFDDTETMDFGKTIDEVYPDRVKQMEGKLAKLSYMVKAVEAGDKLPLFEHVRKDAVLEALKRGVINCKLMRMGKAQPLDAKLLTPSGWKRMGDIQLGDLVIGRNGRPAPVTGIFPKGKKEVFRVEFSDESSTECCDEHLWLTRTPGQKYKGLKGTVRQLKDFRQKLIEPSSGNTKYYIPMTEPVEFEARQLPMDPYLTGLLLGDGTLSCGANGYGTPMFATEDAELVEAVNSLLPAGMRAKHVEGCDYALTTPKEDGWRPSPLCKILTDLDMRHRAESKYIPDLYKFSSIIQRRLLLKGLLDTDGDVSDWNGDKAGTTVSFSSTSERLCDDVQFLVESLGGVAYKASRQTHYTHKNEKRDGQPSFRLRIVLPEGWVPFRLKRKANLYRANTKFTPTRGIVKVDLVGEKECQCITVATPDHLYLTDHCIVTHNTSEAITICELWGSKKIGIVGTRNVRLAWRKEFKRLGMKNFVFVNRFEDLDKEGKYYLFTLDWLKDYVDPSRVPRKNFENYLRASQRKVRRTVSWSSKPEEIIVYQHNTCPHCQSPLERPLFSEEGVTTKVGWTTDKGYLCRNQGCSWTTDNRCKPGHKLVHDSQSHRGAAWAAEDNRVTTHKPGAYVDEALARHARCSGEHIKGRMCLECGAADSTWTPPRYRRVKDLYSAVVGDEIHNAKEYNTQNARAMYSFRSRRRIAMTGTLLSNSPLDAYWPLHWAVARPCPQFPWQGAEGKKEFENRFCDFVYLEKPTGEIDEETGVEVTKTIRKRTPFLINPPDWWRTMQPKIVRRNYSDPLFQQSLLEAGMKLPCVSIKRTIVPMATAQAKLMLAALRDFRVQFEQMVEEAEAKGNDVNKALVIAKMSALRTIATSPERLNQKFGYEVYTGPPGGGKMRQIVNLVAESVAQGKKVFILSDFIEMQIQVEKALQAYNPIRMPSSWGDEKRVEGMELFANDPTRHVFIAGTRSVREAIDVSCADVTICCDLLWSPAWQCQAWSRTMAPTERDRDCEVYLMLSQNSLDEYIYTVFYSKMVGAEQALDRKVMNRRALDFDVKFFAQRVLEEEEALSLQIRDDFGDTDMVYMPELELVEERAS